MPHAIANKCGWVDCKAGSRRACTAQTRQGQTSNAANLSLQTAANAAKMCNKPWLHSPGKQTKQWRTPVQMWTTNCFVVSKNPTKNSLLHGTNLLPHHCRIRVRCMFLAGPNKRIFTAIMFILYVPVWTQLYCNSVTSVRNPVTSAGSSGNVGILPPHNVIESSYMCGWATVTVHSGMKCDFRWPKLGKKRLVYPIKLSLMCSTTFRTPGFTFYEYWFC